MSRTGLRVLVLLSMGLWTDAFGGGGSQVDDVNNDCGHVSGNSLSACTRCGPYGGDGGSAFADDFNAHGGVHYIGGAGSGGSWFGTSTLRALKFTYHDGFTSYHGDSGAMSTLTTWEVPAGEHITSIVVGHGTLVDSVQFATSTGRHSPKWGGDGGATKTCSGASLTEVSGRGAAKIDQLSFKWSPTPSHN